jgi:hypothetical protein
MRTAIATSLVLISAVWASAQTTSPPDAISPAKTVTMTGCVASGSGAQPFTLSDALILPDSASPAPDPETPSPVPPAVSSTPTQPAGSGRAASATPAATGTSGTLAPASTGTSGSTAKKSSARSYRLTGTDMTPWAGKRVQVSGAVVPASAAPPAASATGAASGSATVAAPLEFKVLSVQGIAGPCPKP